MESETFACEALYMAQMTRWAKHESCAPPDVHPQFCACAVTKAPPELRDARNLADASDFGSITASDLGVGSERTLVREVN